MGDMSTPQILALCAAGFIYGMTKTGIFGLAILIVPLLLHLFTPGEALGLALPMLIMADAMAIFIFRKTITWRVLIPALPPAMLGILVGWRVLLYAQELPDGSGDVLLRRLIAGVMIVVVAAGVILRVTLERGNRPLQADPEKAVIPIVSGRYLFASGICGLGGFATMIANNSAPAWVVYFMLFGLDKKHFLGTSAWLIFIINIFKLPFAVQLGIVNVGSLATNALMIPFIVLGAVGGRLVVGRVSQAFFDNLTQVIALLGAVHLLLSS